MQLQDWLVSRSREALRIFCQRCDQIDEACLDEHELFAEDMPRRFIAWFRCNRGRLILELLQSLQLLADGLQSLPARFRRTACRQRDQRLERRRGLITPSIADVVAKYGLF
jgi:hypothetical protein